MDDAGGGVEAVEERLRNELFGVLELDVKTQLVSRQKLADFTLWTVFYFRHIAAFQRRPLNDDVMFSEDSSPSRVI